MPQLRLLLLLLLSHVAYYCVFVGVASTHCEWGMRRMRNTANWAQRFGPV